LIDRRTFGHRLLAAASAPAPPSGAGRRGGAANGAAREDGGTGRSARGWTAYLADPRSAVLFFLASAAAIGGGRKLLQEARARRAVAALGGPDPTIEEVEAAAGHGRAGLIDLFRLLGTAAKPETRAAAGRALARIWSEDELIAEEEKALVRRGYAVDWRARRRYPRGLRASIPIGVEYGVPFLVEGGPGVAPTNLEWSHRILGGERARLEEFTPWHAGPGSARFAVDPGDFPSDGPHRLALHARARTVGLTGAWEVDLPHMPFSFEFDPNLAVGALLTLPDDARGAAFARAVRLEPGSPGADADAPRHLDLNADLVLRDPPALAVDAPLPCDLAHAIAIEIEGVPGRFPAGSVVVAGQGSGGTEAVTSTRRFPLGPIAGMPADAIDRPGERRIRAVLSADPDLGWADPDVRSIWPGTLTTDWATVRVIRR